jgi:hypothetical protein
VVLSTDPGNGIDKQEFCLLIRQGATRGADAQTRSTCIGHGDKGCEGKTLYGMRKNKMMRWRKIPMKELGFLPWPNVLYL